MTGKTPKKASRKDWHPADIVAAIHKRGLTLRDIANHHGMKHSSSLSKAMVQSYPANERRLAEAAGVPVQEMFAARYYEDGTPLPRGIRGARKLKSSAMSGQCNGKSMVSA